MLAYTHTHINRPAAKKIKSGLRKLGSLRRSPNRVKPSGSSSPRPYISAPMPLKDTDHIDSKLQYPHGGGVVIDNRIRRYNPDDGSCDDSVSVSSQSEFSSATGTDDRSTSSPLGDRTSSSDPIDIVSGRVCLTAGESDAALLIPDSGVTWDSSLEATLCADNNFSTRTVDSGVNLSGDRRVPSVILEVPSEKVQVVPVNGTSVTALKDANRGRVGSNHSLIDFERVPSDPNAKLQAKADRHNVWKDSIVEPVSDSDTDSEKSTPSTSRKNAVTFKVGSITSSGSETVSSVHQSQLSDISDTRKASSTTTQSNEAQVQSTEGQELFHPLSADEKRLLKTSLGKAESPYANLFIPSLAHGASIVDPLATARTRSKSSSPRVPKKPKPLPRMALKNGEMSKEQLFISSLPSDFRALRPTRPMKTTTPAIAVSYLDFV